MENDVSGLRFLKDWIVAPCGVAVAGDHLLRGIEFDN